MSLFGFSLILVVGLAAAVPAGVVIGKDGTVGASFGGYSASAGLGGVVGEGGTRGGLHAEAAAPGYFAAAGLGGTAAQQGARTQGQLYATSGRVGAPVVQGSASAPSPGSTFPGQGQQQQPGSNVFDDIFNIPISTLGAVNQYLNNRRKVQGKEIPEPIGQPLSPSSAGVSPGDNQGHHNTRTKYDDIFNIPISVLSSVNRFLNGK